ncbi:hypothetical protein [Frisingicoccus sp.]
MKTLLKNALAGAMIITLIALLGSIGRSNEPESLSKPYIRGAAKTLL